MKLYEVFNALGNPHRVQIMQLLLKHPQMTSGQIAKRIKLSTSATSQHLALLRESGLVVSNRLAQTAIYHETITDQRLIAMLGEDMSHAGR